MPVDDYVGMRIRDTGDLGYHVNKIRSKSKRIDTFLKDSNNADGLTKKLEEIYKEKYQKNIKMFKAAELLDMGNRYVVAPVDLGGSAYTGATGDPQGVAYSFLVRLASWVPKLLYAGYYTIKTGDKNMFLAAGAQELTSTYAPKWGGLANIPAVYSKVAQAYLHREAAKEFEDYIDNKVVDLETERKKRQPPLEEKRKKAPPGIQPAANDNEKKAA